MSNERATRISALQFMRVLVHTVALASLTVGLAACGGGSDERAVGEARVDDMLAGTLDVARIVSTPTLKIYDFSAVVAGNGEATELDEARVRQAAKYGIVAACSPSGLMNDPSARVGVILNSKFTFDITQAARANEYIDELPGCASS